MPRITQSKERSVTPDRPPLDQTRRRVIFGRLLQNSHFDEKVVQGFQRRGALVCVFDILGDECLEFRQLRISTV